MTPRTSRSEGRSSAVGIAVRATLALAVVVALLAATQGGPAYFLQLGEESPGLERARAVLGDDVPTPLVDGHDGDRFWQLARDPLLRDDESLETFLDRPVYRAQRIGYPLLAAPWHLLGEGALLWGLVVANLAVAGVGTYAIARWSLRRGRSAMVGYLFALHPLTWLSLLFDLGDSTALLGLLAAVLSFVHGPVALMVVAACGGALAKESVLLGLVAVAAFTQGSWQRRALLVLPAAAVVATWRLYILSRPGLGDDPEVEEFVFVPFEGYWQSLHRGWIPEGMWVQAALSLGILLLAIGFVVVWVGDRRNPLLLAGLPYALMAPFLSVQVVSLWHNVIRAVGPALLFGAMQLATNARGPASRSPAAASARKA